MTEHTAMSVKPEGTEEATSDKSATGDKSSVRSRTIWIVAALFALLNCLFVITEIGEPDAARIFNDVLVWEKSGDLVGTAYRAKTSPLYLLLAKAIYGVSESMPFTIEILSYAGAIAGAALIIPLYHLWRDLFSKEIAFAAVVALNFIPAYWVAHSYAFPTIVAFLLLSCALLTAHRANEEAGFGLVRGYGAATLLAAGAGAFKADVILAAGAFPMLLLLARPMLPLGRFHLTRIVACMAIVASIVLCPLFLEAVILGEARPESAMASGAASDWTRRFPIDVSYFFSGENVRIMVKSFGAPFALMAILGTIFALFDRRMRVPMLTMLAWAGPAILFWGLREGNSSRHLMVSYAGLAPSIAVGLHLLIKRASSQPAVLTVLVLGNYFSDRPSSSTVIPSTRLIESRYLIQATTGRLTRIGRDFLAFDAPRRAYFGTYTIPYAAHPMLDAAQHIIVEIRSGASERMMIQIDGRRIHMATESLARQRDACSIARNLRAQDYAVMTSPLLDVGLRCQEKIFPG